MTPICPSGASPSETNTSQSDNGFWFDNSPVASTVSDISCENPRALVRSMRMYLIVARNDETTVSPRRGNHGHMHAMTSGVADANLASAKGSTL
jgi:hypothetical protein